MLIAAARHVQVRQPVAVGVEEQGTPVVVVLVGHPGLTLNRLDEAAVSSLNEQFARDALASADEDVIQPIAVHVRHGEGRPLPGRLIG